jgi:hypothetical protein
MNACRKLQAFFLASLLHPILAFLIGPFGSFILFARVELSFCCIQQFRRLAYLTAPILVTAKCSLKWGASIHRSHSDIRGVCTAPASCFSSQKLNSPSGELLYSYRCASRFFQVVLFRLSFACFFAEAWFGAGFLGLPRGVVFTSFSRFGGVLVFSWLFALPWGLLFTGCSRLGGVLVFAWLFALPWGLLFTGCSRLGGELFFTWLFALPWGLLFTSSSWFGSVLFFS